MDHCDTCLHSVLIGMQNNETSVCSLVPCPNSCLVIVFACHCHCGVQVAFTMYLEKQKDCFCISFPDFCIEERQLAFRDGMESALLLNEENCWIAVGEGGLEDTKISEQKIEQNWEIRKEPLLSVWLCYVNSLCFVCNVEIMISIQLLFPLVD